MLIKGQTHTLYKNNSMLLHPNNIKHYDLLLLCIPNTYQFFLFQPFAKAELLSFFLDNFHDSVVRPSFFSCQK